MSFWYCKSRAATAQYTLLRQGLPWYCYIYNHSSYPRPSSHGRHIRVSKVMIRLPLILSRILVGVKSAIALEMAQVLTSSPIASLHCIVRLEGLVAIYLFGLSSYELFSRQAYLCFIPFVVSFLSYSHICVPLWGSPVCNHPFPSLSPLPPFPNMPMGPFGQGSLGIQSVFHRFKRQCFNQQSAQDDADSDLTIWMVRCLLHLITPPSGFHKGTKSFLTIVPFSASYASGLCSMTLRPMVSSSSFILCPEYRTVKAIGPPSSGGNIMVSRGWPGCRLQRRSAWKSRSSGAQSHNLNRHGNQRFSLMPFGMYFMASSIDWINATFDRDRRLSFGPTFSKSRVIVVGVVKIFASTNLSKWARATGGGAPTRAGSGNCWDVSAATDPAAGPVVDCGSGVAANHGRKLRSFGTLKSSRAWRARSLSPTQKPRKHRI